MDVVCWSGLINFSAHAHDSRFPWPFVVMSIWSGTYQFVKNQHVHVLRNAHVVVANVMARLPQVIQSGMLLCPVQLRRFHEVT